MSPIADKLSFTPEITAALAVGSPVAFSVSGGKDGSAATLLINQHLDQIGHPKAMRKLIHADLGRIEWRDSLPSCERLADRLGLPLEIVQRNGGGMIERWLSRWSANVARYQTLSSVCVISPWSSSQLRFCTSELKMDPIARAMKQWSRSLGDTPLTMVSVLGLRREESAKRAKAPVSAPFNKACLSSTGSTTLTWNPILSLSKADVFQVHRDFNFPLHAGYALGNGRISCGFCVLADLNDLTVGSNQAELEEVYVELVKLELASLFSFQGSRWLATVNPAKLSAAVQAQVVASVKRAEQRRAIEATIPKELLYTKGWPTRLPTTAEAKLLASVRNQMADLYRWDPATMTGMTPAAVTARYQELMDLKDSTTAPEPAGQLALAM